MKLAVIIATCGRPAVLGHVLTALERQSRQPDLVVISATGPEDVPARMRYRLPLQCLHGGRGLTAQRNAGLALALDAAAGIDAVVFFDDDFLPGSDYLDEVERLFATRPDLAVVRGRPALDGASGPGLSVEQGLEALAGVERAPRPSLELEDQFGAMGCNMAIRATLIGSRRFDERLVLYGWQEDIDFTSQFHAGGRVVCASTLRGIHLGSKAAKLSGVRLGYSQMVNPAYLIRKGTMSFGFALPLMLRNLLSNLVRSLRPEAYIDRRGRLRGNALGLADIVLGHLEPERVLALPGGPVAERPAWRRAEVGAVKEPPV